MAIKAAPVGVMSIPLMNSDASGETVFYMRPATARDDLNRAEQFKTRAYAYDGIYGPVTKIEANIARVRVLELWSLYDHAECIIISGEGENEKKHQPFKPVAEMTLQSFQDAYYMLNADARTELWSETIEKCAPQWRNPF